MVEARHLFGSIYEDDRLATSSSAVPRTTAYIATRDLQRSETPVSNVHDFSFALVACTGPARRTCCIDFLHRLVDGV